MNKLQLTFAIIKPHAVKNPYALQQIHQILADHNFEIIKRKQMHLTFDLACEFYAEHRLKFFFNRLQTFMCSGPIVLLLLAKPNAIADWRDLMGPTKVFKSIYSHPNSLRGMFGLTDTRNVCHGSDSEESVKREIEILCPEFNVAKWYETNTSAVS